MKCKMVQRLLKENEELREKLRHAGDGAPYEQRVKELEEELYVALDVASTLLAALEKLTREEGGDESTENA